MTSTTNPRRYQDDLRRIVGIDEGARGLAPADPKPRIPGARGIAYTTESGGSATASGNAPSDGSTGTKVPTGASDGSNESGYDGLSSNGQYQSGIDGVNPGDFINPTDGPVSVDDLFDGKFGIGGNIPILTGFDCDTGKELQFIFDGGFIPPDGWDSPDLGPFPDDYVPGSYERWSIINNQINIGSISVLSRTELPVKMAELYGPQSGSDPGFYNVASNDVPLYLHQGSLSCPGIFGCSSLGQLAITGADLGCEFNYPYVCMNLNSSLYARFLFTTTCASMPDNVCNTEPDRLQSWPSDNTIQLSRQEDGTWITSERDPDRTTPYTQPLSAPEFCDAQGRKYKPWPGRDGSIVFRREDDGFYYVRNSDGRAFAFGSGSTIRDYLPPAVLPEIAP